MYEHTYTRCLIWISFNWQVIRALVTLGPPLPSRLRTMFYYIITNFNWQVIRALVTLGAPHYPPPPPVKDMTQGALTYTDKIFPGAHMRAYGMACVTVGSGLIVGDVDAERGTPVSELSVIVCVCVSLYVYVYAR
jgi:hypothetical protein